MIEYLDLEDLPGITRRAVGGDIKVGDYGSLASALARPHFRCSARMPVPIYTSRPRRTIALSGTPPRADGREQTACVDGMSNVLSVNGQWISAPEDDRIEFCRLGGHGRRAQPRGGCRATTCVELPGRRSRATICGCQLEVGNKDAQYRLDGMASSAMVVTNSYAWLSPDY